MAGDEVPLVRRAGYEPSVCLEGSRRAKRLRTTLRSLPAVAASLCGEHEAPHERPHAIIDPQDIPESAGGLTSDER